MNKNQAKNIVFSSLAKWGNKQSERDLLSVGDHTASVTVSAKCGRFEFNESIDLTLSVAADSTQSRAVKKSSVDVLALVFDVVGVATQKNIVAALEGNQKPSDVAKVQASLALKRTNATKSTSIRGAVTLNASESN